MIEIGSLKYYVATVYEMEKTLYNLNAVINNMSNQMNQISEPSKPYIWHTFRERPIYGILHPLYTVKEVFRDATHNKRSIKDYEKSLTDYNNRLLPLKEYLKSEIDILAQKYYNIDTMLQKLYSQNIIYQKYRNLIAISSFYDYLMSGRCFSLEGPDGAYNMYELESRMDKIITRFDMVIECLGQIQYNQFMLYQAIQETNNMLNSVSSSLNSFSQTYAQNSSRDSAVLNYISQVSQKEEDLINRFNSMYRKVL